MEELERSKFTAAGEIANQRLIEAVIEPDLPQGNHLPRRRPGGLGPALAGAVAEHRPLAIVYPDGREIVAAPRGGALAFFEHLLTRRRESKHGQPAIPLPADYQVEIRDRDLAAA